MTAKQYRAAIAKLGLSQRAAAKYLGVNERTSRRWAKDGCPHIVGNYLTEIIAGDWIRGQPAKRKVPKKLLNILLNK